MVSTRLVSALLLCAVLSACGTQSQAEYPSSASGQKERIKEAKGSILGDDGLSILGSPSQDSQGGGGTGIAVNSYLWRASLDTITFMPLVSADPFGGVIITDWYSPPETPNERFKVTVYILGRDLRADGVRTSVFRQRLDAAGAWRDVAVEPRTGIELEEAILTRARQMRVAGLQ